MKKLADGLWGAGRVMTGGVDLTESLAKLQVPADVLCPEGILWKHRQDADSDIYFLSNQNNQERSATLSFRSVGRSPELWWPDSGKIEAVPFTLQDGRTLVPLHFDASGSVFVAFRKTQSGIASRKLDLHKVADLNGPWQVAFGAQRLSFDKLLSWTEHADPAIKYFSGTATYASSFEVAAPKAGTVLDLGRVDAIATVRVNGRDIATLWKPPYSVDITAAVKPGSNTLEVAVVNTWMNRLVGDEQTPAANRTTFTTTKSWNAKTRLRPSGLLGPVTVSTGEWVDAK